MVQVVDHSRIKGPELNLISKFVYMVIIFTLYIDTDTLQDSTWPLSGKITISHLSPMGIALIGIGGGMPFHTNLRPLITHKELFHFISLQTFLRASLINTANAQNQMKQIEKYLFYNKKHTSVGHVTRSKCHVVSKINVGHFELKSPTSSNHQQVSSNH